MRNVFFTLTLALISLFLNGSSPWGRDCSHSWGRKDALISDFIPTDVSTIYVWYRSDIGVAKDGSNRVSQWDDLTGNGYHLCQVNAANMLLWEENQINGYPSLRIDSGANDWLKYDCPNLSQPYTIFCVIQHNASTQNTRLLARHLYTVGGKTGAYIGGYINWTSSISLSSFRAYAMLYNADNSEQWIDFRSGDVQGDQTATGGLTTITIGSTWETCEQFQIAEYIVYNDELSELDRDKIIRYLMKRYKL